MLVPASIVPAPLTSSEGAVILIEVSAWRLPAFETDGVVALTAAKSAIAPAAMLTNCAVRESVLVASEPDRDCDARSDMVPLLAVIVVGPVNV